MTGMKEIILNRIPVHNSGRIVDEREAEAMTFDGSCAEVKGKMLEWIAEG